MSTLFLVLQFILAVVLTIAILLQKSSSIGLGAYSGSNESLFGAKGPAGFLAKFTFVVGFVFILNTIALGYTYNETLRGSVTQSDSFKSLVPDAANTTTPENSAPAAPAAPAATVPENSAPAAPAAPAATTPENSAPAAPAAPAAEQNSTETNATK